ncbi:MAG: hypothetical protein HC767_13850 [Akkermansiaceae bacterium]|nr:hypothetical protein [Akkermansiaceae bacterium]
MAAPRWFLKFPMSILGFHRKPSALPKAAGPLARNRRRSEMGNYSVAPLPNSSGIGTHHFSCGKHLEFRLIWA